MLENGRRFIFDKEVLHPDAHGFAQDLRPFNESGSERHVVGDGRFAGVDPRSARLCEYP